MTDRNQAHPRTDPDIATILQAWRRPVVCFDETSKALHTTPHGILPPAPGQTACEDYEYARQGTVNVFLMVEPLRGWRKVRVTQRRTLACLYERFAPEEARRIARKLEWHYTPEHRSWLNMAEVEPSVLVRQCNAAPNRGCRDP